MTVLAGAIFTIGHSTRPIAAFVELLQTHGIERLVDVRTIPRSRRHPQFEKDRLAASLAEARIAYRHMPDLGGLRKPRRDSINTAWKNESFRGYADYMQTPAFAAALERAIDLAKDARLALMCAEAVPWRCHRSLIADALVARGFDVFDIVGASAPRPHALTAWARVDGTRVTYPGLPIAAGDRA